MENVRSNGTSFPSQVCWSSCLQCSCRDVLCAPPPPVRHNYLSSYPEKLAYKIPSCIVPRGRLSIALPDIEPAPFTRQAGALLAELRVCITTDNSKKSEYVLSLQKVIDFCLRFGVGATSTKVDMTGYSVKTHQQ